MKDYFPSYLLLGMVVLLILASFIPNKPDVTNGLITVTLMVIGFFEVWFCSVRISSGLARTFRRLIFYLISADWPVYCDRCSDPGRGY